MSDESVRTALGNAIDYLTAHPKDAEATDSVATATIEDGLRCKVTGPDGAELYTDMVTSVGGGNTAPSPGWMLRAATASCVATLIAMKAALDEVELGDVEVTVDSQSNDLGILGIDDGVSAGPLSVSVRVKAASNGTDPETLRKLFLWAHEHCPVCDLTRREVPLTFETEIV
ncbi:MAG TPA: OsmC family protein [Actinomycetota bacterium]|nr:OsmC family protein [Actinomycetota bacterium]